MEDAAKGAKNSRNAKKDIILFGTPLTLENPGYNPSKPLEGDQLTALTLFGVDGPGVTDKEKRDIVQALYDGKCNTDKPLVMLNHCEPIRRIVQSLALNLLSKLGPDGKGDVEGISKEEKPEISYEKLPDGSIRICLTFKPDQLHLISKFTPKALVNGAAAAATSTEGEKKPEGAEGEKKPGVNASTGTEGPEGEKKPEGAEGEKKSGVNASTGTEGANDDIDIDALLEELEADPDLIGIGKAPRKLTPEEEAELDRLLEELTASNKPINISGTTVTSEDAKKQIEALKKRLAALRGSPTNNSNEWNAARNLAGKKAAEENKAENKAENNSAEWNAARNLAGKKAAEENKAENKAENNSAEWNAARNLAGQKAAEENKAENKAENNSAEWNAARNLAGQKAAEENRSENSAEWNAARNLAGQKAAEENASKPKPKVNVRNIRPPFTQENDNKLEKFLSENGNKEEQNNSNEWDAARNLAGQKAAKNNAVRNQRAKATAEAKAANTPSVSGLFGNNNNFANNTSTNKGNKSSKLNALKRQLQTLRNSRKEKLPKNYKNYTRANRTKNNRLIASLEKQIKLMENELSTTVTKAQNSNMGSVLSNIQNLEAVDLDSAEQEATPETIEPVRATIQSIKGLKPEFATVKSAAEGLKAGTIKSLSGAQKSSIRKIADELNKPHVATIEAQPKSKLATAIAPLKKTIKKLVAVNEMPAPRQGKLITIGNNASNKNNRAVQGTKKSLIPGPSSRRLEFRPQLARINEGARNRSNSGSTISNASSQSISNSNSSKDEPNFPANLVKTANISKEQLNKLVQFLEKYQAGLEAKQKVNYSEPRAKIIKGIPNSTRQLKNAMTYSNSEKEKTVTAVVNKYKAVGMKGGKRNKTLKKRK